MAALSARAKSIDIDESTLDELEVKHDPVQLNVLMVNKDATGPHMPRQMKIWAVQVCSYVHVYVKDIVPNIAIACNDNVTMKGTIVQPMLDHIKPGQFSVLKKQDREKVSAWITTQLGKDKMPPGARVLTFKPTKLTRCRQHGF